MSVPQTQRGVLVVALCGVALIALAGFEARGWRHLLAVLIGAFAGIALYHAAFGFTAAWRRLQRERRGAGVRAQLLLIALTVAVAFPLLALGPDHGVRVYGNIMPMGVASALGAFAFGVGMQLGGGCASGTLFTAGGGSTRMLVVLGAFIFGSVWATAHLPTFWNELPRMGGVSLLRELGLAGALAAMAALLAALWWTVSRLERRRHGGVEPLVSASRLTGPWSLAAGAIALAIVGVLTLVITGRPWGITAGFALWGAQLGVAFDIGGVGDWAYWTAPHWRAQQLGAGPFASHTSLMNFGILLGAMAAAALAGRWAPVRSLSVREVSTALVGGLLMGYGARLAYGCNIGAYFGGVVSGSLHGWWWLIFGFAGSVLGTRLRAWLAMDPAARAEAR